MSAFDWRKLKVMVATPHLGDWKGQFGMAWLAMMAYWYQNEVPGYRKQELVPLDIKGSILPQQRWDAICRAKEQKCSHLLFVDADQTFPRETLHRLLIQKKDLIGANIAVKKIPSSPTARAFSEVEPEAGVPLYTPEGSNEIQRGWRLGCGVLMLSRKAFELVEPQWLEIRWQEKYKKFKGEDWGLVEGLEKAGIELWVDHGLSNRVDHIGDYAYNHDVVGEVRKEKIANG